MSDAAAVGRPNLFKWASSELAQDAVLAWLAAWADRKWADENPALHAAGRTFVAGLLHHAGLDADEIDSVHVERQVHGVDVAIVVNGERGLLIEDKTTSIEHSGQLERYLSNDAVRVRLGLEKTATVAGLYVKTGNEWQRPLSDGWRRVTRRDLLKALPLDDTGSDILDDFREHLQRIEDDTNSFRRREEHPSGDRYTRGVEGLYAWLDKHLDDATEWRYVANANGGFIGRWWGGVSVGSSELHAYLQMEHGARLYVRLAGSGRKVTTQDRDALWSLLQRAATEEPELGLRRTRFRSGDTSAVAELLWSDAEDRQWRVYDSDGRLDEQLTLDRMRAAQTFMDRLGAR